MNIDRFISRIRTLRESAPTNSTGADIANFDKFLFPVDDDLITQDYQTPAELGLAKDEFLGVYPVMKLQLDKSSDGPSIDSMVDASKEFVNKMSENTRKNSVRSPLENIREIVRNLNEDRELRKLAAQERSAERKAEKDYRSKGRKVPEKKKGPKMSTTPRPKRDGKEYADHILSSPALKNMREDAPVNSVGNGAAVSLPPSVEPGVDLRRKNQRNWNPFFKDMARVVRRNSRKNGKS